MRTLSLLIVAVFACISALNAYDERHISTEFNKKLFTMIYDNNSLGNKQTRSGMGSTIHRTMIVQPFLTSLIRDLKIKTLLDAPCGDFNWMKEVDLSGVSYFGVDIVDELIQKNTELYGTPNRQFFCYDILHHPLPQVDLVICRDFTQHFPDNGVRAFITNIKKSGSRYLLTSNYSDVQENSDLKDIYNTSRITYRNLRKAPFNFPKPTIEFPEAFDDKMLCLWEIDKLPSFE